MAATAPALRCLHLAILAEVKPVIHRRTAQLRVHAAIDHDARTGDVGGVSGSKKGDGASDIGGPPLTRQRDDSRRRDRRITDRCAVVDARAARHDRVHPYVQRAKSRAIARRCRLYAALLVLVSRHVPMGARGALRCSY